MPEQENPFSIHRAEHLGKDLHKLFAMQQLFSGRLGAKSLVLEGGRGCGKTMFFIYHTYESKKREHFDQTTGRSRILERENILGVYFHAKSEIVTAFCHRNLDEETWMQLFSHYFNIVVSYQIVDIAKDVASSHECSPEWESSVCGQVSTLLDFTPRATRFSQVADLLRQCELEVLRYVGNPSRFPVPTLSIAGTLPKVLTAAIAQTSLLNSKVFHIFVDEFENLLEYQQKVINTLIKTPSNHLVVDVGLRKEGWRTRETLADGESISPPHDFNIFEFEVTLTPEEYESLLLETCRKRLEFYGIPSPQMGFDSHNIKSYLGEYDLETELRLILRGRDVSAFPYKDKMKQLIRKHARDDKQVLKLAKKLSHSDNEVINRLNYCLLLQGKPPEALLTELEKKEEGKASKYVDWIHNYEMGVVFLLCRDARIHKRYWGFTTFALLSSGTIRYFLELCEKAFTIAMRKGFQFSAPRALTIEEQDAAAQSVSARKVEEVDSYSPHGAHLKNLVGVLGSVFESLHEDPKVSEPERNHFHTRIEELSAEARDVLRSAALWNVVQERPVTKDKSPSTLGPDKEYHLNHIYSPFFQISYRRKRSLYIKSSILEAILAGDLQAAKRAGKSLLAGKSVYPTDKLESDADFPTIQTELWVRRFEHA